MKHFIKKLLLYLTLLVIAFAIASLWFSHTATAEAPEQISCDNFTEIKDFAKCEVEKKWGIEQWEAFELLIQKESSWKSDAINPTSGACGLVQSLPCKKLGDNWQDPQHQIMWGIDYVDRRYGNPQGAIEFHLQNNWY